MLAAARIRRASVRHTEATSSVDATAASLKNFLARSLLESKLKRDAMNRAGALIGNCSETSRGSLLGARKRGGLTRYLETHKLLGSVSGRCRVRGSVRPNVGMEATLLASVDFTEAS